MVEERQVNNWRALNRLEKAAWAPTLFSAFSAWFCVTEFNYATDHNSDLAIVLGWLGAALVVLGIAVAVITSTAAGLLRAQLGATHDRSPAESETVGALRHELRLLHSAVGQQAADLQDFNSRVERLSFELGWTSEDHKLANAKLVPELESMTSRTDELASLITMDSDEPGIEERLIEELNIVRDELLERIDALEKRDLD